MKEFVLTVQERKELVEAKIRDSHEMLEVAKVNCQYGFYNSAINRLYYACFHIASAALLSIGLDEIRRHEGVRNMFSMHFIKEGKLDSKWNHFYPFMFSCRSNADYDSFQNYSQTDIEELLPQVSEFVETVNAIILDNLNKLQTI